MKTIAVVLVTICSISFANAHDWDGIPVPANPGKGKVWQLQSTLSDDFDYSAPAGNKGAEFNSRWIDTYHSAWTGPGKTIFEPKHSFVADGCLHIIASRAGSNQVYTGCITSKYKVRYPVYVEARTKISNSTLSSDVWMLSPDDTQEIDIEEAYGTSYSAGARKDQTWFAERLHLSHHMFIRHPFKDYQPKDPGSWYYNGTLWRKKFHRIGVYWKDPFHLEYYVDGKLVRTVAGAKMVDPGNFADGKGLSKAMNIIIDAEDQVWRSKQGITPTNKELSNGTNNTFEVDWIRVYKPVEKEKSGTTANQK